MRSSRVAIDDKRRYEVILAGVGGQGLVLSGIILGEAAILEGKNTVQTQSYGIASRGGLSLAEVIIDSQEIIYQQVEMPNVILALTEETLEKYSVFAGQGVTVLYDSTLAKSRTGVSLFGYPFTKMANDLGTPSSVNIISLGALTASCAIVDTESLVRVLQKRFNSNLAEESIKALQLGADLVKGA